MRDFFADKCRLHVIGQPAQLEVKAFIFAYFHHFNKTNAQCTLH
jgi:hypothetical protein